MGTMENGNLTDALREVLAGKVAFIGVGNTDRADDGAGVALARLLQEAGVCHVFEGGLQPERLLPSISDGNYDAVLFIDAVDAGEEAGSIVLMHAPDIKARFPQVSTHKISLGVLAGIIMNNNGPDVYLLGIQPETIALNPEAGLSTAVDKTVNFLVKRITEAVSGPHPLWRSQLHVA
jgi:hydrogenase maturation protease